MVDLLDRSEAMLSEFARTLNPRRQQSRLMSQLLETCAERAEQLQILAGDIENGDQAVWGQQEFDGLVVYGAPSADKELPRFVELDATPKIFVSATLSSEGVLIFFAGGLVDRKFGESRLQVVLIIAVKCLGIDLRWCSAPKKITIPLHC